MKQIKHTPTPYHTADQGRVYSAGYGVVADAFGEGRWKGYRCCVTPPRVSNEFVDIGCEQFTSTKETDIEWVQQRFAGNVEMHIDPVAIRKLFDALELIEASGTSDAEVLRKHARGVLAAIQGV